MKKDSSTATIADVKTIVSESTEQIVNILKDYMQHSDGRFEKIDQRFDKIDTELYMINVKLAEHTERLNSLDKKYDHLLNTMDAFIKQLTDNEAELAARDHKIARLEAWIEAIALKTGVVMPTGY